MLKRECDVCRRRGCLARSCCSPQFAPFVSKRAPGCALSSRITCHSQQSMPTSLRCYWPTGLSPSIDSAVLIGHRRDDDSLVITGAMPAAAAAAAAAAAETAVVGTAFVDAAAACTQAASSPGNPVFLMARTMAGEAWSALPIPLFYPESEAAGVPAEQQRQQQQCEIILFEPDHGGMFGGADRGAGAAMPCSSPRSGHAPAASAAGGRLVSSRLLAALLSCLLLAYSQRLAAASTAAASQLADWVCSQLLWYSTARPAGGWVGGGVCGVGSRCQLATAPPHSGQGMPPSSHHKLVCCAIILCVPCLRSCRRQAAPPAGRAAGRGRPPVLCRAALAACRPGSLGGGRRNM